MIRVDLHELHPGLGDWGQRWAPERGFSVDRHSPGEIFRAAGIQLEARPVVGDHIHLAGDDYSIKRVTWVHDQNGGYRCVVHGTYTGEAFWQ